MLRSYFKTAFRFIGNNKAYAIINITGLSIAMAACWVILLFVAFDRSYDDFHSDADNIYRIQFNRRSGDNMTQSAWSSPGVGKGLKENFPEITSTARVFFDGGGVVTSGEITFEESRIFFADNSIFDILSFDFKKGDDRKALEGPNAIVISRSIARKYFASEDVIGKSLILYDNYGGDYPCAVTGVFEDLPENTHMHVDLLISYPTLYKSVDRNYVENAWDWHGFYTYVKLAEGVDSHTLENKFEPFIRKNMPKADSEESWKFSLQPVRDIHLNSNLLHEAEINGDRKVTNLLFTLAFAILGVAIINFVNLSSANSMGRVKEIGVRKVMGSRKAGLTTQFLIEASVLNTIALIVSVLIVFLVYPVFESFIGRSGLIENFLANPKYMLMVLTIFLVGVILSGGYPAFLLASLEPIKSLKGKFATSKLGTVLRRSLLVFQFTCSITLLISSLIIYKQIELMKNKELGFDLEQKVVIKSPLNLKSVPNYAASLKSFKDNLKQSASVSQICNSRYIPGKEIEDQVKISMAVAGRNIRETVSIVGIDEDFLETYGIKTLSGRNFDEEMVSDATAVILNEAMVKQYGFANNEEALGKNLFIEEQKQPYTIVGVIQNYHHNSVREHVFPLILYYNRYDFGYLTFKITSTNIVQTLAAIENVWNDTFPGNPFHYFFLDTYFERHYIGDEQLKTFLEILTGLSLLIGCLGLSGLTTHNINQRMKEIGVRKCLGANNGSIIVILSLEFLTLFIISAVIAVPLIFLYADVWLSSYPDKIQIAWWYFIIPLIFVLGIFAISVVFKLIKASQMSPINVLKSE